MNRPVIRLRGLRILGDARELLSDIWLDVYPGEVTGVLGLDLEERSALTDFLTGSRAASAGTIYLERERIAAADASAQLRARVGYVGPKERLSNNLTIAENLYVIGRPRAKGPRGWLVDETALWDRTKAQLERAGIPAAPDTVVGTLDDDERHRLELVRAMIDEKHIIALNSPLKRADFVQNQEKFTALLEEAKREGIGIVMMLSSLENLMRYCDYAVIVRKGRTVSQLRRNRFDRARLMHLLVERPEYAEAGIARAEAVLESCVLELREVAADADSRGTVSLCVRQGEAVGLVNPDDEWNGRFAELLCGQRRLRQGVILRNGAPASRDLLAQIGTDTNRMFLIQSDEMLGLLPRMSLQDNVLLPVQNRVGRFLQMNGEDVKQYIRNVLVEQAAVRTPDEALRPVSTLSMEQKLRVWMARAAIFRPDLCIMLGLRTGLNAEAQRVLDEFIRQLTAQGAGVLLIETSEALMHRVTDTVYHI